MASNKDKSEYYGELQKVVDSLFRDAEVSTTSKTALSDNREDLISNGDFENPSKAKNAKKVSTAEKLGISDHTAHMLGIAAFDADPEPVEPTVSRLQAVMAAEAADLPEDLMRIVNLLPPGEYTRLKLTTQLNSAITGHAWGQVYGTVS